MAIKDDRMDHLADLIVDARCALENASSSNDAHSLTEYALKCCREAEMMIKDILGDIQSQKIVICRTTELCHASQTPAQSGSPSKASAAEPA